MRLLRAVGFAISYPVTRVGGVLLSRLARAMKNSSDRRNAERRS